MATCGECPCFKWIDEDAKMRGNIMADGWCDFKAPVDLATLQWGDPKELIDADREACSLGPLLMAGKALK